MSEVEVYTVAELATKMGCGVNTVYEGIKRNEIPHLKIGKRRKILPRPVIDRWWDSAGAVVPESAPLKVVGGTSRDG